MSRLEKIAPTAQYSVKTPRNLKPVQTSAELRKAFKQQETMTLDNIEESKHFYKLVDSYSKPGSSNRGEPETSIKTVGNFSLHKNVLQSIGKSAEGPTRQKSVIKSQADHSNLSSPPLKSNKLSRSARQYIEGQTVDESSTIFMRKTSTPIIFQLKSEIKRESWKLQLPAVSSQESLQKSRLVSSKINDSSRQQILALSNRDTKGKDVSYFASDSHSEMNKNFAETARSKFRGTSSGSSGFKDADKLSGVISHFIPASNRKSLIAGNLQPTLSLIQPKKYLENLKQFLPLNPSDKESSIEDLMSSLTKSSLKNDLTSMNPTQERQTYFDLVQSKPRLKLRDAGLLLSLHETIPHCLQNLPSNKRETELLSSWFSLNRHRSPEAAKLALAEAVRQVFVGYSDRGRLILDIVSQISAMHDAAIESIKGRMEQMNEQYERRVKRCEDVFQETIARSVDRMSTLDLQVAKLTKELNEATEKLAGQEAIELR